MTVVDASIVVRILQNRMGDDALRERFAGETRVEAPSVIDAEVASALRGLLRTTKASFTISDSQATVMVAAFARLPVERYAMLPLIPRVLKLRHNFTAYDAFYVALAEALDEPLLTSDQKFAGAAGHHAVIETWR